MSWGDAFTGAGVLIALIALLYTYRVSRRQTDLAQQRRHVCEVEWPPVLDVPDPSRVYGRAILVYDDVFTDGLLLNTVARKLRQAGATTVCQVTLARQPWARSGR